MSTCHQAHNIPWGSLVDLMHKEKIPVSKLSTYWPYPSHPGKTRIDNQHNLEISVDEEGKAYKRVKFFAKKVHAAIKEFSQTERKKYDDKEIDNLSPLFEEDESNEWLSKNLRELSAWDFLKAESSNYYGQMHVIETVKELFIQEKVAPLLCLASKGIWLERLQFQTYSNFFHYGVGRIKEDCLTLYIHLNVLLATGTICNPDQWHNRWMRFREQEIMTLYDGNSQARLYREYFVQNPKFEDAEGLQNLLKKLFRILYLYDMVMAERGKQVSWEDEVMTCVHCYYTPWTKRDSELWSEQLNKDAERKQT